MKPLFPTEAQLQHYRTSLQFFQVFTDAEWDTYCSYVTRRRLKNKEVLVEVGTVCQDLFFLDQGAVRYFCFKDGTVLTNYFSFAGALIGAYSSFVTGNKCLIGLEAVEPCQVLVLRKADFERLGAEEGLAFKMEQLRRRIAEYVALSYEERLHGFLTQTPKERYMKL